MYSSVPQRDNTENCREIKDIKQRKIIYTNGIIDLVEIIRSNPSEERLTDLLELVYQLSEEYGISKNQAEKNLKKRRKEKGAYKYCFLKEV